MTEAAWINAEDGAPEYSAAELRRLQAMFLFPGTDRFGAREGVRPWSASVVTVSGTTWTQHDLTAVVYPGLTTVSGPYVVEKAEESGSLDPADGSNPRLDALDLQVLDDDEDASGDREVKVVYVAGTPAGTPSAPALTDNSLRLATILVPAGSSPAPSVSTLAPFTVAAGGVLPVRDEDERPSAGMHDGMTLFNMDTGAVEIRSGTDWPVAGSIHGFQLRETVTFTSSDTFSKADYEGLRAVRYKVQGAGGGGGGAEATESGEAACGGGGGGGGYAEGWVVAGDLGANETVTVGSGGNGGSSGNNAGSSGGSSSFGSHGSGSGGGGGGGGSAAAEGNSVGTGGTGGGGTGDLVISGSDGRNGRAAPDGVAQDGDGGGSHWGGSQRAPANTGAGSDGSTGNSYGGGGSGAVNGTAGQSAHAGGDGAPGRVVVEVWV